MSDRLIFHGRRICHSRKPACGACGVSRDCPSFGLGPTDYEAADKLVRRDAEDGLLSAPEPDRDATLPESLARLAAGARVVRAEEISRFVPPETGGRPAAVLMLFADGPAAPTCCSSSGQPPCARTPGSPPFPAARSIPEDDGAVGAALREAAEEVGLDPASVEIIAELPAAVHPGHRLRRHPGARLVARAARGLAGRRRKRSPRSSGCPSPSSPTRPPAAGAPPLGMGRPRFRGAGDAGVGFHGRAARPAAEARRLGAAVDARARSTSSPRDPAEDDGV